MKTKTTTLSACIAAVASAVANGDTFPFGTSHVRNTNEIRYRYLQDYGEYAYLDDVSGYNMQYGKCLRVKVPQNNDDDEVEGNQQFYNGRYHAEYKIFASFVLCEDAYTNSGSETCGSNCDYSTEYAMELSDYLEISVDYVQKLCNACSNQCRRRRLEDEAEGEEEEDDGAYVAVDCNTCKNQCEMMWNRADDDENGDESNFLECQEAHQSEDGVQYYSAPQCGSDGEIIIGLFYDDECTIKTSADVEYGFDYNTFRTVEKTCVECSNANGICDEMYGDSLHCVNGKNMNGNVDADGLPVCYNFMQAGKVRTYNKRKKHIPYVPIFLVISLVAGIFSFLSYSYYVRHTRSKTPLANLDHDVTNKDLPAVS